MKVFVASILVDYSIISNLEVTLTHGHKPIWSQELSGLNGLTPLHLASALQTAVYGKPEAVESEIGRKSILVGLVWGSIIDIGS